MLIPSFESGVGQNIALQTLCVARISAFLVLSSVFFFFVFFFSPIIFRQKVTSTMFSESDVHLRFDYDQAIQPKEQNRSYFAEVRHEHQ